MIAKDAVNFVLRYPVSDTETLRKVHLFMWAEPYDGAVETRADYFGPQDLPPDTARARIAAFLAAARAQATSPNPVVSAAARDAAERLQSLVDKAKPASS